MNFVYALYLSVSAVILLILAAVGWRRRSVPAGREFALFSASTAILVGAYALELTQDNLAAFKLILHLEWLTSPYISVFWLLFSLVWCGYGHIATRSFRAALFVIPTIDLILAHTNEYHHLVYREIWVNRSGPFPIFETDNGPVLWIDIAYSTICVLITTVLLIQQYRTAQPLHRRQALIMMLAALIPTILNVGYYLGASDGVYLTTFGLSITAMMFAWGIFRHHFLDVTPVARYGLVEMMRDPVLVFDENGRVVDHNRSACRLLHSEGHHDTDLTRADIVRRTPELAAALERAERGEEDSFRHENKVFSLSLTTLQPAVATTLTLCLLHDVTGQSRAEEKLREHRKRETEGTLLISRLVYL